LQPQQPFKDARSSLDARNARLGTLRPPRPHEDGKTEQHGETSERSAASSGNKDTARETKRVFAGDARLDTRTGGSTRQGQRKGDHSTQVGQRDKPNEFFQHKFPTNKGIYDKSGSGRANSKQQSTLNKYVGFYDTRSHLWNGFTMV
jgi:hypothetical protein